MLPRTTQARHELGPPPTEIRLERVDAADYVVAIETVLEPLLGFS
jgi:hypothetical protein